MIHKSAIAVILVMLSGAAVAYQETEYQPPPEVAIPAVVSTVPQTVPSPTPTRTDPSLPVATPTLQLESTLIVTIDADLDYPPTATPVARYEVAQPAPTVEVTAPPQQPGPTVEVAAPPQPTAPGPCDSLVSLEGRLRECTGPWANVVDCESGGNVSALNPRDVNGLQSLGVLQFQRATWDGVALAMGWGHLVGVDPRSQPLSTQLAMGEALRAMSGLSPWPNCGHLYGT